MSEAVRKLKFPGNPKWVIYCIRDWARWRVKMEYDADWDYDGAGDIMIYPPSNGTVYTDVKDGTIRIEGPEPGVDKIMELLKKELDISNEIEEK